jgi:dihydrolipoamide dehydrogenase
VKWARVVQRKNQVVSQVVKGVEYLMKHNGIRVVAGRARLAEPKAIAVDTGGREETITADKVVVATGSVTARLPVPGMDGPGVLTSTEMLDIDHVPESLAIIGGGYVGVEFADIFSAAGSEVTIVEMLPRIVPTEDEEIAAELARAFRRRRIEMHVNARVVEVGEKDGKQLVRFEQDGKEHEVAAEVVLSAAGRWPNTEGAGLEESGIEADRRAIRANGRMETSAPDVYACGDAIGGIMLAHVASAEGKVAVANALGAEEEMDYTAIPSVVYTHPEIGSTGLSEAEAAEKGIDVKVGRFAFRGSGKARAEGEREGLVKIVADAASGRVLGGQICGPHATDLIHEVVLAVRLGATVQQVGDMVHAHPTLMEPIMEAAEDVLGRAIHK